MTDDLFCAVRRALTPRYGEGEARAIALLLFEEGFGLSRTSVYAGKVNQFSQHERERLHTMCEQLVGGVPVQQVLGGAWFCARRFRVTPDVLIPRPETEELVAWAVELASALGRPSPRLLDAGTGSGCIAVSCYLALKEQGLKPEVEAWDVSAQALEVAKDNAQQLGAEVKFSRVDLLGASALDALGEVDVIVSNPPYVCERERAEMEEHVLEHEPGLALFVPNDDPLRFYKALCRLAQQRLSPGGWLVVEGNCAYAEAMRELFVSSGLQQVEVRNDCFGRPRMVAGKR